MKREKGITLIALVVTIVVLIILAAVSISMLTGENGIITQAQNSKEATEQARVEELVDLAVNSLIGKNLGSTNEITPEDIANEVNEMESRTDIYAEGNTFPTNIIFPEEGRKVEVDLTSKEESDNMYEVEVDEADIAPTDLFDYEIIDETAKTAKITRIKPKYCNMDGYNPDTETYDLDNTNGNIVYDDKSFNTLVLPYEVELNGNKYKIIEVQQLRYELLYSDHSGSYTKVEFPHNVNELIFPNTIEKIYDTRGLINSNDSLKTVVLSNRLKLIGKNAFCNCSSLTNITIPSSVTSIEESAFKGCTRLISIVIPNGVTSIEESAFEGCTRLISIVIPNSVTNLGDRVFTGCSSLTSITIPNSITIIGRQEFYGCENLNNITIPSSVTTIKFYAFGYCTSLTTVNYRGTQEQWNEITIESDNEDLTNATKNYNYTGE